MHLKMKTSMGGPDISVVNGDEIPFDESFPFSAAEVHRFRAAEIAELVGSTDAIAAWLKANPIDEPVAVPAVETNVAADATKVADGAAKADVVPPAKAAAAKVPAKKG